MCTCWQTWLQRGFAHLGVNSKPRLVHKDDFCSSDLNSRALRGRKELKVCEGLPENANISLFLCVCEFCWWLESCWGRRSPPRTCLSWHFTGCSSCWNFLTCHTNMTSKMSIFIMWYLLLFILLCLSWYFKNKAFILHDLSHNHLSVFSLRSHSENVFCQTLWNQTAGSSGIWGWLKLIFMTPYLVHLLPVFMGTLQNVSGNLCVTFLQACLQNEWQTC